MWKLVGPSYFTKNGNFDPRHLPPQELHYGYPILPTPELEKKPSAALENDSIQHECLQ